MAKRCTAVNQKLYVAASFLYEEFCILGYNTCSPLKVDQCFGKACRIHLHGRKMSQVRNKLIVDCYLLHATFLLGVFFYPEDGGNMLLRIVD
jgi:hypothetical protein